MSSTSKKPLQSQKSTGKQTTLFGFFQKRPSVSEQTPTPASKRVEARSRIPLTPLPSSEVGEDVSPVRNVRVKETGGLRTPVTPVAEKDGMAMDIDSGAESSGTRKVYPLNSQSNILETSRC
jgi:hypothetical protein